MTTIGPVAGSVPAMIPTVHAVIAKGWVLTLLSAHCFAALWYIMAPDRGEYAKNKEAKL